MDRRIRVVVVNKNRLLLEGLAFVLAQQPDMTVAAAVSDVENVRDELESLRSDVVILDLQLPEREGYAEARLVHRFNPNMKILMLGLPELESDVLACIEAGAAGYLPTDAPLEQLVKNVRALAAGEAICSPRVTALLIAKLAEASHTRELHRSLGLPNLTRRELEVVTLIHEGLSNKGIATRLQIEVQTVKNHVHNILDKLRLGGRRDVARYAKEQGLTIRLR